MQICTGECRAGKSRVGEVGRWPNKIPLVSCQSVGKVGLPEIPPDLMPVRVVLVRFVLVRFAPVKSRLDRSKPVMLFPVTLAAACSCDAEMACKEFELERFAPVRFVVVRVASVRVALVRVAPSKIPLTEFLQDFCQFLSTIRTSKSFANDVSILRIFFGLPPTT